MDGKNHGIHLTSLIKGSFFTVLIFVLACFSISPCVFADVCGAVYFLICVYGADYGCLLFGRAGLAVFTFKLFPLSSLHKT